MNSYPTPSSRKLALGLTLALFAVTAASAFAHPAHGMTASFTPGLLHPLSGWDHALAMIAVGLWATQLGAPRLLPAAFLASLTVGALLGHSHGSISGLEQAIAASVLVLGLLVARAVRLHPGCAVTVVGVFALFHGWAHGAEMPATSGGFAYGAGFLLSTALLLAVGVMAGTAAQKRFPTLPAATGWAVAAAGVALVLV